MFKIDKAAINSFIANLQAGYRHTYRSQKAEYAELIGWVAEVTLQNIANSDAPYHDVEHTMLVTLAGQEILRGKHLREGRVSCEEWLQTIVSLLCHDIGYIKGICHCDRIEERRFATGIDKEMVYLPPSATDASLTPYHVDRGKRFVEEYFSRNNLLDIAAIQHNIELTRFPVPADREHQDTIDYPGLARAADLIGQLSDPRYLQKMTALFEEFEEVGTNKHLGYHHPSELRASYPNFFWNVVHRYIEEGVRHLEMTDRGQEIISNLYGNVFIVERELFRKEQKGKKLSFKKFSSPKRFPNDKMNDPEAIAEATQCIDRAAGWTERASEYQRISFA